MGWVGVVRAKLLNQIYSLENESAYRSASRARLRKALRADDRGVSFEHNPIRRVSNEVRMNRERCEVSSARSRPSGCAREGVSWNSLVERRALAYPSSRNANDKGPYPIGSLVESVRSGSRSDRV